MKNNLNTLLQKPSIQVGIIFTVTLICYVNILWNGYGLDDPYLTDNKFVLQGVEGLYHIWTNPYIEIYEMKVDYRPLSLTLYSIEHIIFGKNPMVSHALSIGFYLIILLLLYRLSKTTFKLDSIHPLLPLLIVLLYAVHPSHTEVVASLKNRDELMSFSFMLLAALYFDKSFQQQPTGKVLFYVAATFVFFYLSLLSKLISLPFLSCLFLWTLYTKQFKNYKIFLLLLAGYIIIVSVHFYSVYDYYSGREYSFYENPVTPDSPIDLRLGLGFNSLLFYLKFMLIPFPFRFYYGHDIIPYESFFQPMPLFSLLLYVSLTGLLIYSIIKKRPYSFFLFAFLFLVLLYSNLIGLYPGIVSERSMFQFSYFFIAFLLISTDRLYGGMSIKKVFSPSNRGSIKLAIYLFFLLVFSTLTILRNFDWKDVCTLALNDLKYLKKSALANEIAAINFNEKSIMVRKEDTLKSREWAELSVYYFKEALLLAPDRKITHFLLANTYRYSLVDLNQAEKHYLLAEQKGKDMKGLARQLGSLFFMKEQFSRAIPYYDQAVKEEPEEAELVFYRALNMYNAKNTDRFLVLNAELLKKFPTTQYPYLNYGTYYYNRNDTEKTVENFEKAVKYGCENQQVIGYLINYFNNTGNSEKVAYYKSRTISQ